MICLYSSSHTVYHLWMLCCYLLWFSDVCFIPLTRDRQDWWDHFCSYLPCTVAFTSVVSNQWSNRLKMFQYCLWKNDASIITLCALSFYSLCIVNKLPLSCWIVLIFVQRYADVSILTYGLHVLKLFFRHINLFIVIYSDICSFQGSFLPKVMRVQRSHSPKTGRKVQLFTKGDWCAFRISIFTVTKSFFSFLNRVVNTFIKF